MNKISENIRILRKEKGITQVELAKALGVSKGIISFWENGERDPSSTAVTKLAKYFDISADILLGIKEW